MTPEQLYANQQQYRSKDIIGNAKKAKQIGKQSNNKKMNISGLANAESNVVNTLKQISARDELQAKENEYVARQEYQNQMLDKQIANRSGLGNTQNIVNAGANNKANASGSDNINNFVGKNNSLTSKASRNNNPGNITGMSGKLLYGASGIARSNTGDKGDRAQLVYRTPQDGWNAMRSLMSSERYNNAPIRQAFKQYQTDQNAYANILKEYMNKGINVDNQTFNSLSPTMQNEFMKTRARFEGYRGIGPV